MTQFFYTREVEGKKLKCSFNINKIIRTEGLEDGRILVLLDDLHERSTLVPDINPKTGKQVGMKRQRDTYQSEIYIQADEADKFYSIFD